MKARKHLVLLLLLLLSLPVCGQDLSTQALVELQNIKANIQKLTLSISSLENQLEIQKTLSNLLDSQSQALKIQIADLENQLVKMKELLEKQKALLAQQEIQYQSLKASYLLYRNWNKFFIPLIILETLALTAFIIF